MTEKPGEKIEEYRHLLVNLSHMMQQLGKAYSNMYGTGIIATYGSLSEIMFHGATYSEVGLFVIMF